MKKITKSFLPMLLAGALALNFASCSNGDDSSDIPQIPAVTNPTSGNGGDNGSDAATATLPESKGKNTLAGKTFSESYDFDTASGITGTLTWKFGEDTCEFSDSVPRINFKYSESYKYTYDETKKLVYLALTKVSSSDFFGNSYSSVKEYDLLLSRLGLIAYTAEKQEMLENAKSAFGTPRIYEYSDKGISHTVYFDGTLPTYAGFDFYDYESGVSIRLHEARLSIRQDNSNSEYTSYPTFKDGIFSGKFFSENMHGDIISSIGTVKGTYSTDKDTVTLTFTELPAKLSSYKNKEFELKK